MFVVAENATLELAGMDMANLNYTRPRQVLAPQPGCSFTISAACSLTS
jgi:hypothetical protein